MSSALENTCEQICIELMQRSPVLNGMGFFHNDSDSKAVTECIVVTAEAGEKQYAGVEGFPVEVTAIYRTNVQDAARIEAITEAMTNSVCSITATTRVPAMAGLCFLSIEEGGGSSRENEKDLRKRTRKFSFIAKEKA